MIQSKVNPTRINLLKLKADLKTAKRGHKLLKDKRDGLMKKFIGLIHQTKTRRRQVDQSLNDSFQTLIRAAATLSPKVLASSLLAPNRQLQITTTTTTIMSVPIPEFNLHTSGNLFCYGFLETNGDLDQAIVKLNQIIPELITLAAEEQAIANLSLEIEKTRRRTNVMEHTIIPNLKKMIKSIALRLEERDREAVISQMRLKARLALN